MKKLFLCAALLVSGCKTVPTTLPQAMEGIQEDFAKASPVSFGGDVQTWSDKKKQAVATALLKMQCQQNNADATVLLVKNPISISLQGSFSGTGNFTVAGSGLSAITLAASLTKSNTSQIAMSVNLVPISGIAEAQANAKYEGLAALKLDDSSPLVASIVAYKKSMQAFADAVVSSYNPALCTQQGFSILLGGKHG